AVAGRRGAGAQAAHAAPPVRRGGAGRGGLVVGRHLPRRAGPAAGARARRGRAAAGGGADHAGPAVDLELPRRGAGDRSPGRRCADPRRSGRAAPARARPRPGSAAAGRAHGGRLGGSRVIAGALPRPLATVAALVELAKPRITFMVLVTTA